MTMANESIPTQEEIDWLHSLTPMGQALLRDRAKNQPAAGAAAFSGRHDTPHGQTAMQEIHDLAARHGATCRAGNTAAMASSHESKGIQAVHDTCVEHGATCASGKAPAWALASMARLRGRSGRTG